MLIIIENLLDKATVARFRAALDQADWIDGKVTGGSLSARVKSNEQLAEQDPLAIDLGNQILAVLGHHPLFISAALPHRIYPPKFNRYHHGACYGSHVDSAIMPVSGTAISVRTDVSATVFLCEPEEYDGGELTIETAFGAQQVKLGAGDMVLYPSSSLHQVTPVTRGARTCAFLWLQSLVRDEGERALLFDLDQSIQGLSSDRSGNDTEILRLTGVYHNLLRRWAQT